ncbi:hypothetical protein ACFO5Q_14580 [Kordiimonas lipolytica]|uniref:Uncharacterized protein n=1 Tax=Kordiimonas lipolytica TaxID=1662421 RepID=A0ABV8UEF2_9PROT|nr:hypothetical protein [Kordiimonas lipolytica]
MTEDTKPDINQKNAGGRQKVTQAILWAAALIGSALLLKGTEQADKVMWLLIVLAATSTLTGGSLACERRMWRKLIGKSE